MNPRRVAALLLAVAAAVVLVLRVGGPAPHPPPGTAVTSLATPVPAASAATPPAADAPGNTAGQQPIAPAQTTDIDDDSALDTTEPTPATRAHGDAAATATAFARAWTRHTGPAATGWATRLAALCTPTLAGKLRGVDPAAVPADTVTAAARLTLSTDWADATITTTTGTLHLTLIHDTRWKVNTLDWAPAR